MERFRFHFLISAFFVGVAVRTIATLSLPEIIFIAFLGLGILLVWRKNYLASSAPALLTLGLIFCFVSLGILRTEIASWQYGVSPLEASVTKSIELKGTVIREPDIRANSTHLYIESGEDVLLVTVDHYNEVSYGDVVVVQGTLKRPESFVTELGREFNYPGYLLARGVEYQISFATVEVIESDQGNPVVAFLLQQKHRLMASIEARIPEPHSGLGEGLLLGVKQALGEDLETAFRQTGIIHIVVLSGYNVMLVVAFVMYIFSFLFSKRMQLLFGLISITSFALLVGLSATVVRACIMACLVLAAQTFGKTYDVLRGLLLAGAAMVLINPYLLLYDIGFQLSFMATLGLLLVAPHIEVLVVSAPAKIGIRDFLVATIATQIAVLPLLLYYIGEVSLIAVVVNVLVLPMVPVAMFLTFLTGVVGIVSSSLAALLGLAAYASLSYIIMVATWCARLPFASVTVPVIPAAGVFILYALLTVVLYWRYHKQLHPITINEVDSWVIEEEFDTKIGVSYDTPTPGDTPSLR